MPRAITQALLETAAIGFNTSFNQGMEAVKPTWNRIAMEVPSSAKGNFYPWLKGVPGFREWIGSRHIHRLEAEGFQVINKKFEHTLGVSREDLEDDNLGVYTPVFQMQGAAAAELPDELVWGLLPSGFTAPIWDGQYFFDTDHPVLGKDGKEVSVSNFGGGTGTPWFLVCTGAVRKPFLFQKRTEVEFAAKNRKEDDNVFFDDEYLFGARMRCTAAFGFWQMVYASRQPLTEANFNAAYDAMVSIKGDYGRPLANKPNLLVVPTNLRAAANEVIKAERLANGATNTNRDLVEIHVEQRL